MRSPVASSGAVTRSGARVSRGAGDPASAIRPRRLRAAELAAAGLTLALVTTLCGSVAVAPAHADPSPSGAASGPGSDGERGGQGADAPVPTAEDVRRARDQVRSTAGQVAAIRTELLLAQQRLEAAAVQAAQAAEAYNGARWELAQARRAVRTADREMRAARRTLAAQRDDIGALVAESHQQGTEISAATAVFTADGPEGVLDSFAAFDGAAASLQADYQRFAATDSLAEVFADEAREARLEQRRVAGQARAARAAAAEAAEAAQGLALTIGAEKERLIRSLAEAQDVSVSLARQRQSALEERARQRAAAAAERAAARAAAREQERQQARQQVRQQSRQQDRQQAGGSTGPTARQSGSESARADRPRRERSRPAVPRSAPPTTAPAPRPDPRPAPPPTPRPTPPAPSAPAPQGGAQAVVGFARAQLGEMYVWGAAGPSTWDCSGLTMRAWQQAGVSLPHYSVAQYSAGTPISAGQLRPGDLAFWSSSSSPDGIFHVALYAGGGQIIHAPRTGRPVTQESLYYWTPPTHFARP